jgi:hypothetical protein
VVPITPTRTLFFTRSWHRIGRQLASTQDRRQIKTFLGQMIGGSVREVEVDSAGALEEGIATIVGAVTRPFNFGFNPSNWHNDGHRDPRLLWASNHATPFRSGRDVFAAPEKSLLYVRPESRNPELQHRRLPVLEPRTFLSALVEKGLEHLR